MSSSTPRVSAQSPSSPGGPLSWVCSTSAALISCLLVDEAPDRRVPRRIARPEPQRPPDAKGERDRDQPEAVANERRPAGARQSAAIVEQQPGGEDHQSATDERGQE